jgi:hypothetical protein
MTDYRPWAYRLLLLSKREITAAVTTTYDPEKDEGPLRLKDAKYYWNTAYTSEFMIEDDLSLDRCTGFNFRASTKTHHAEAFARIGIPGQTGFIVWHQTRPHRPP